MSLDFAGRTDRGRSRKRNEDALLQRPDRRLFAVADGMGGHSGGDIASRIAVDILDNRTADPAADTAAGPGSPHPLKAAILAAHDAIREAGRADPALRGMGTTLTALRFGSGEHCVLAHVGDSRAYRYRGGTLEQLSRDQTWVQRQVDAGLLTPAAARHHPHASVLTSALGIEDAPLQIQLDTVGCEPGDTFLLCSDGLTGELDDAEILAILRREPDLGRAADELVAAANEAGGSDNITVVLVRV
jgi:PPM family protein phosphatase